ncbi:hypothetical protein FSARC_5957 [Fusarium sarcochroum]|uniref:Zn(2)-C6 fungal-type domain-containing protein n=1 Tax=Fusarium sarcochroum TaxID=1208366 RepID=A0A8H4TYH9_9HYPO|nr:hypothetical protein FSARC_5957 [Fusarium sarcochroum]
MSATHAAPRRKHFSQRSKTGCTTCRKRHIRCDEERPAWRERRALRQPGEQLPWSAQHQQPPSTESTALAAVLLTPGPAPARALDPFYALPIEMPLQSRHLLHYFSQVALVPEASVRNPSTDSIAAAINDPCGLRNILLIAAFQYAWKFGHLGTFDQTFLFHKFQTVRLVNAQLSPSDFITVCADYIITLCFSECTFGNFDVAEAHLKGMLLYMEAQDSTPKDPRQEITRELCNRYFILAYNMVQGLKSRLDDYLASLAGASYQSRSDLSSEELERLVPEWHSHEAGGAGLCFDAMSLFPSFFSSSALHDRLYPVDASSIIACVRNITQMFDMRNSVQRTGGDDKTTYQLWDQGGPSRLFSAVVNAHVESCSPGPERPDGSRPDLQTSWIGISVVVGMYLTSILGVWNQGQPEQDRLLRYITYSSQQDLERSFPELRSRSKKAGEFWFWKLFVTALHLAHAGMKGCNTPVHDLRPILTGQIRVWADLTETRLWRDAKDKLAHIIWPTNFEREDLAESVWNEALQQ